MFRKDEAKMTQTLNAQLLFFFVSLVCSEARRLCYRCADPDFVRFGPPFSLLSDADRTTNCNSEAALSNVASGMCEGPCYQLAQRKAGTEPRFFRACLSNLTQGQSQFKLQPASQKCRQGTLGPGDNWEERFCTNRLCNGIVQPTNDTCNADVTSDKKDLKCSECSGATSDTCLPSAGSCAVGNGFCYTYSQGSDEQQSTIAPTIAAAGQSFYCSFDEQTFCTWENMTADGDEDFYWQIANSEELENIASRSSDSRYFGYLRGPQSNEKARGLLLSPLIEPHDAPSTLTFYYFNTKTDDSSVLDVFLTESAQTDPGTGGSPLNWTDTGVDTGKNEWIQRSVEIPASGGQTRLLITASGFRSEQDILAIDALTYYYVPTSSISAATTTPSSTGESPYKRGCSAYNFMFYPGVYNYSGTGEQKSVVRCFCNGKDNCNSDPCDSSKHTEAATTTEPPDTTYKKRGDKLFMPVFVIVVSLVWATIIG